ncbi:aldo/keto reductase [Sneathiella sp. CAU 1612]|uniref:Aldo/keto reductase n=1 Tax=Sneathiella sedimenti TaxID=2816034 RepID=A0ABS3F7F1_9PROT|nr:aldo/keto reductase [Sneathiella sedimenti]MBO0334016.1 aldo/keto reductase [Sneathiella sedimenti]
MQLRKLGNELNVSSVGLGCMGMSFSYGGQEEKDAIATLHRAIEIGITHFDTAELYGPFENEILLGKAFQGRRDKVTIATKFGYKYSDHGKGFDRVLGLDSRPGNVKAAADASLKRLKIDVIDLFYQHRVDPAVPIEDTVGAMADLVQAGKVRAIGLSEASAATIRRAHAVHPISAVQSEYSLWSREPESEVIPMCRELGIGFVAYSPLGRGLLTGKMDQSGMLSREDWRLTLPRFQPQNMKANENLIKSLNEIASRKDVTAAQISLAWVLHQGNDIVTIPGSRKIQHLEENTKAFDIDLNDAEIENLSNTISSRKVVGKRYSDQDLSQIDG